MLVRLPWKLFTFIELFICAVHLERSPKAQGCDRQTLGQREGCLWPLHISSLSESHPMAGRSRVLGPETLASLPAQFQATAIPQSDVSCRLSLQTARVRVSFLPLPLFLQLEKWD